MTYNMHVGHNMAGVGIDPRTAEQRDHVAFLEDAEHNFEWMCVAHRSYSQVNEDVSLQVARTRTPDQTRELQFPSSATPPRL